MPAREGGKMLWERWQELWNGDLGAADEILAPGFVAHLAPAGNSAGEVRGPGGLKRWIAGSLAVFADHGFASAGGPLASGNVVVGRWVFRAARPTFGGAPGARVERAGVDILRVEESGLIAEYCPCADVLQALREGGPDPECRPGAPSPTKP